MTAIPDVPYQDSLSWLYPPVLQENWRNTAQRRLNEALANALRIPFTDQSRFVFFSDLHRGNGARTDLFMPNKPLFLRALRHYYTQGYTYVEVGDGDELWLHYDLAAIRRAHGAVFDLLHQFYAGRRLFLLYGNHDMRENGRSPRRKDGIPVHESVLLHHQDNGQTIFVCHGHQADLTSERFYAITRMANRHVWRYLRQLGLGQVQANGTGSHYRLERIPKTLRAWMHAQPRRIEQRLLEWSAAQRQPLICGHTHFAAWSENGRQPYFNTGNGIHPGVLTGLEIGGGAIHEVRWLWDGQHARRESMRQQPLAAL